MNTLNSNLAKFVKSKFFLYKLIMDVLGAFGYWKIKMANYKPDKLWSDRIEDICSSADNNYFDYNNNAGSLIGPYIIMHNGLKVFLNSYYGVSGATLSLLKNRGVHEPQEEKAFDIVLNDIQKGGTMLELGSFWGFYSMCFANKVKNAKCHLVEPIPESLQCGINNFKLNGLNANYTNAYVSDKPGIAEDSVPVITVDDYIKSHKIEFLDVLHSDIQGYEYKMLLGAEESMSSNLIKYVFISTHSNSIHYDCIDLLKQYNYQILAQADLNQTFSYDGLIVAKNKLIDGIDKIDISLKVSVFNQ